MLVRMGSWIEEFAQRSGLRGESLTGREFSCLKEYFLSGELDVEAM
jgi:hypothetical protein